ncbi:flagellar basal body L-ring protein FlgH [Xanthomonas campestris pv. phormiicola]|nr:flagellar basal body L-ring protein FlgH [Xanthomonas campestris pv. phormiicola]UYC17846.1 flagellar basal body L-ring protein FlgH [Xanthomonas campestris pv. phormiicola]
MPRLHTLAALLLAAVLGSCATFTGELPMPAGDDMPPLVLEPQQGSSGGVFVPGMGRALTADNRAYRVGDVLTVDLEEATQASNSNKTAISKDSQIAMPDGKVLGAALTLGTDLGIKRDNAGTGTTSQNNSMAGALTVIVQKVLPNGLLQIGGEKSLMLNQNVETVRLSGYVRSSDLDASNRVSSQRVADARIRYSGRGEIANANRGGWLTRFFNHPLMPF